MNSAKTLHDISTCSSLYFPLSNDFGRLPSIIQLDQSSLWHTSALLSTLFETMTLPTRRLKMTTQDHLEAVVNVNRDQRIVRGQCSISDPSRINDEQRKHHPSQTDERIREHLAEEEFLHAPAELEVDFFPQDRLSKVGRTYASGKAAHVFGDFECVRARDAGSYSADEVDMGAARKRRRIAGVPVLERFVRPSYMITN